MNKINRAIYTIEALTNLNTRNHWMNKLHPLFKLCLTVSYILIVMSYDKYDLARLIPLIFYPIIMFAILDISMIDAFKRTYIALIFVIFMGIFNPIFDTRILVLDNFRLNAGYVSFLVIVLKGLLTILATYILICTTSLDDITYALKSIHMPNVVIATINLIIRYFTVLLLEFDELSSAYNMRSFKKGINIKDAGSFIGLLLLRTIDRSKIVYESMSLRGFNVYNISIDRQYVINRDVYIFVLIWILYFIICRNFHLLYLIGGLFR